MWATYLSNGNLTLRAMVATDADQAMSWFPSPFPVSAGRAGRWLAGAHRASPWDDPVTLWLAVVRRQPHPATADDARPDEIVGLVRLDHPRARTSDLSVQIAPHLTPEDGDRIQAEVVRLVVPWVRDELEAMVLTLSVGSDQAASIAAADEIGMVLAARLREHLARPGGRADLLWYQALNPTGRVPLANVPTIGATGGGETGDA